MKQKSHALLLICKLIIPSQSILGKNFAKHLAKGFRKTSNVLFVQNVIAIYRSVQDQSTTQLGSGGNKNSTDVASDHIISIPLHFFKKFRQPVSLTKKWMLKWSLLLNLFWIFCQAANKPGFQFEEPLLAVPLAIENIAHFPNMGIDEVELVVPLWRDVIALSPPPNYACACPVQMA